MQAHKDSVANDAIRIKDREIEEGVYNKAKQSQKNNQKNVTETQKKTTSKEK